MISKAGKWVGVKAEKFPDALAHFTEIAKGGRGHGMDTGLPWLGRAFASADEYLTVAKSVVTNPSAKKILYYHGGKLNLPRLGYVLERQNKVFIVAVNEAGQIVTFHNLTQGWEYVKEGSVFGKLFKIDPF